MSAKQQAMGIANWQYGLSLMTGNHYFHCEANTKSLFWAALIESHSLLMSLAWQGQGIGDPYVHHQRCFVCTC